MPMSVEATLRDKLATCTRIFAMQQLLGLFGHISAYDPATRRVYMSPGQGADKATLGGDDILVADLSGQVLEGDQRLPIEWPIHTVLHGARDDALAIAHLHAPYATLFAIAKREFRPVTLQGSLYGGGVPLYREPKLVKTVAQGEALAKLVGTGRAAFMRGHGITVIGRDIEEMLYASLILEDEARKSVEAATLGELDTLSADECRAFDADVALAMRSQRAWGYYCHLEQRWDRQPNSGRVAFA